MKTLAIESSASVRSVAICVGERQSGTPPSRVLAHAESASNRGGRLASLVDEVLEAASVARGEVDAIAVGVGPGSAAGIRSTLAFAHGWEVARRVRLHGVSSVWAVAAEAQIMGIEGQIGVVIRGPMARIYLTVFRVSTDMIEEVAPIRLFGDGLLGAGLDSIELLVGPDVEALVGGAETSLDEESVWPRLDTIYPTARGICRLLLAGIAGSACPLEPFSLVTPEFVKAPPPREIPGVP